MTGKTVKSESKMTAAEDHSSELEQPIWSVVSFDRCEASGLTYFEAVDRIATLEEEKVPGLCIITDDAAQRVTTV